MTLKNCYFETVKMVVALAVTLLFWNLEYFLKKVWFLDCFLVPWEASGQIWVSF
jgi:hypothetical protein